MASEAITEQEEKSNLLLERVSRLSQPVTALEALFGFSAKAYFEHFTKKRPEKLSVILSLLNLVLHCLTQLNIHVELILGFHSCPPQVPPYALTFRAQTLLFVLEHH